MTNRNIQHYLDTSFKDKHDKWAIAQFPNLPITIWVVLSGMEYFLPHSAFTSHVALLSDAVLFTWAYLEISAGDSYFRQLLGVVVMIVVIVGFFRF